MNESCLFCGLVEGRVEASFVHQEDEVVASQLRAALEDRS